MLGRIGAALIAASVSAELLAAPAMTAGEFQARAEPLMAKNPMALVFSPEAHRLMRIVGESARTLRAQQDADRASGRRPATCLPPKGKAKISGPELLSYLRGLTPAEKSQSFHAVFRNYAARKYPCRG